MLTIQRQISAYNHSLDNNVQYIVVHDVGTKSTAKNNVDYFSGGNRGASAHYFTDDVSIWQSVEECNGAWHCGDGGGQYGIHNQNSIGIEMCLPSGTVTAKTEQNTLELVQHLMAKYGLSSDRVVRHYDASRKNCPAQFNLDGQWTRWINFKAKLNQPAVPTPEKPKATIVKRKHNQYNTVRPSQTGHTKPTNGLSYMVHLTKYGWGPLVESGQLAGSVGKGNTIEAINVLVNGSKDWVNIEAHKAGSGWDKAKRGEGGSTGKGLRIEALKMTLNGVLKDQYNLVYRVHQSSIGWSEWVSNGRQAGSIGKSKGIEAVEIKLVNK